MNNSIIIDSTNCRTDLDKFCVAFGGTDKSPYCVHSGHRHPYTTPYSLLFEPLRHKPIKFLEVGVYKGASLHLWRCFFSQARLYGLDNDVENLLFINSMEIPGLTLDVVNAADPEMLELILQKHTADGEFFDIIVDDASHRAEDQALMIKKAMSKLKQGGFLIIEDIFRDKPEEPFISAMNDVKELISFSTFIICDHKDRFSPGWNNDKMLLIVRS